MVYRQSYLRTRASLVLR
ncbi:hypothetical protein ACSETI_25790 [Pseudomonas aeruginosa]